MKENHPQGEQRIEELGYARDLFVQLFKDDSPLINLGYTAKQISITRLVLRHLEEEGELLPPGYARFGEEVVEISPLLTEGYVLFAMRDIPFLHESFIGFFEGESEKIIAIVDMIPSAVYDLGILVKRLYEGIYDGRVSLEKSSVISDLKSRVSQKTAVFRAAWVDEDTKLELVVETDYPSKALIVALGDYGGSEKEYHTWRRLPVQELDGKAWIPFGRKPNVPNERIRELLDTRQNQARVALTLQPIKA